MDTSNEKVEIVYPKPIEKLDLSQHYNSQELAKKINELIDAQV
jgi:hypothetical protein